MAAVTVLRSVAINENELHKHCHILYILWPVASSIGVHWSKSEPSLDIIVVKYRILPVVAHRNHYLAGSGAGQRSTVLNGGRWVRVRRNVNDC